APGTSAAGDNRRRARPLYVTSASSENGLRVSAHRDRRCGARNALRNIPREDRMSRKHFGIQSLAAALMWLALVTAQAATIKVTGTGDTVAIDGLAKLREAMTS